MNSKTGGEAKDHKSPRLLKEPKPSRIPLWVGVILTLAWVGYLASLSHRFQEDFANLELNAYGDFLAGAFAPLAFLWLVVGFFQQGQELRNSAHALWLQSEELRQSAEAQLALVGVAREQLELEQGRTTAEAEEALRRAKPLLSLKASRFEAGFGGTTYQITIHNSGAPCTDLEISFGNILPAQNASLLSTNEDWTIDILLSRERALDQFDVDLTFKDAREKEDLKRYRLERLSSHVRIVPR